MINTKNEFIKGDKAILLSLSQNPNHKHLHSYINTVVIIIATGNNPYNWCTIFISEIKSVCDVYSWRLSKIENE